MTGIYIITVPGSNACEITMFHQEDAGLNTEMTKLAFRKGIWNYVCKMDNALRRYSVIGYHLSSSVTTSVDLMQKVSAVSFTYNQLIYFLVGLLIPFIIITRTLLEADLL